MLDFNLQDETLREQVGADSMQILQAASAVWADRFHLAREQLVEMGSETTPSAELVLDRDRLASFFGCAFGRDGLLARTALLLNLRDRLERIAVLAPRLVSDPAGMARLRRDAVLARSFIHARLDRAKDGSPDRALMSAVQGSAQTAIACADFVAAAAATSGDRGGFLTPGKVYALSDLGYIAADTSTQRPVLAAAAFLLARWGHVLEQRNTDGIYDALISGHLSILRDSLWAAAEAQLSLGGPIPLPALEEADRELEGLVGRLSDRTLPSTARAGLIAELFALAASGRALFAKRLVLEALEQTLQLLADGLAAETGGTP